MKTLQQSEVGGINGVSGLLKAELEKVFGFLSKYFSNKFFKQKLQRLYSMWTGLDQKIRHVIFIQVSACVCSYLSEAVVIDQIGSVSVDQSVEGETVLPAVGKQMS